MATEQETWRVGDHPRKLKPSGLADESLLEEMVWKDVSIDDAAEYLVPVRWLHKKALKNELRNAMRRINPVNHRYVESRIMIIGMIATLRHD